MPRNTILVVDDERFNLDLLQGILTETYDIMVATSGEQAIKRAVVSSPPDLILLDIQMPGMDGYRVLELLKAERATAEIPVMFVTSMSEAIDEAKGLALGAVDYITKPLVPSVVLARIQTQLRLRQGIEQERILNHKLAGLNDELSAKNQKLLELNQKMKNFLGMAAHDLRNPLASIQGMSELLLTATLKKEIQHEFLTSIKRVSEQMLSILNNLLDISAIESGSFAMHIVPERLDLVLKERVRLAQFTAQSKNIEIVFAASEEVVALFDAERFSQVVDNLLSNAIKFSPQKSKIEVVVTSDQTTATVTVQDQGPGIPETEKERLFGYFQRLSNRPTGGERSTGLGLAIVHKIVDAHAGTIHLVSEKGVGSAFSVTLPRA